MFIFLTAGSGSWGLSDEVLSVTRDLYLCP